MGVLEIIAEQQLGTKEFAAHPRLRAAFGRVEKSIQQTRVSEDEKARIASIVQLCFEYERESDPDEKLNILRTLEEISANELLELPAVTVEQWEQQLEKADTDFAKEKLLADDRITFFLKKYFSFRAKAGLATQAAVARASGLQRSYIAVIEAGEHFPQQKTLQKLAKAFDVDVSDLLP